MVVCCDIECVGDSWSSAEAYAVVKYLRCGMCVRSVCGEDVVGSDVLMEAQEMLELGPGGGGPCADQVTGRQHQASTTVEGLQAPV